ncbi:acyl-CoA dehydrogenase family protein [Rhodococcus jostii]|uniref:Acyl-CoA dehydrogenase family protein n=1 Tax=Rhodococcus jostii TaxID=132919 RepID=A0ABU4CQN0_RHOJO|nr:acyl-CoA dehydrogenase family protein [Rhodococcus jostii]MDV6285875.1 acyl-CoA dehydrogenase family protein [Rhodococcus jostii]
MTNDLAVEPVSANVGPTDEELLTKYRPVFARIAEGALERETSGRLALEEAGWLREVGFPAVRVPREFGGDGASLRQLYLLVIELAAAESNLPHALRVHSRFVEDRWRERHTPRGQEWLRRIGDGIVFGTAVSEREGAFQKPATTLREVDSRLVVNGIKYYSTGALYGDYLTVAVLDEAGDRHTAVVKADNPGVERIDDWAGFGQRASASGTTVFTDAEVEGPGFLFPPPGGTAGHLAHFQLTHLATIAGIVRRATDEIADFVRRRHRTYPQAKAPVAAQDPLIQQVVGRADAAAYAIRATVLDAAASLDAAADARYALTITPEAERTLEAEEEAVALELKAELDAYRAQSIVLEVGLKTTTEIFEVGGASALDRKYQFDRHWRNVRTLASHNPLIYREQQLGDYVLNGTPPAFLSPEGASVIGTPPAS